MLARAEKLWVSDRFNELFLFTETKQLEHSIPMLHQCILQLQSRHRIIRLVLPNQAGEKSSKKFRARAEKHVKERARKK